MPGVGDIIKKIAKNQGQRFGKKSDIPLPEGFTGTKKEARQERRRIFEETLRGTSETGELPEFFGGLRGGSQKKFRKQLKSRLRGEILGDLLQELRLGGATDPAQLAFELGDIDLQGQRIRDATDARLAARGQTGSNLSEAIRTAIDSTTATARGRRLALEDEIAFNRRRAVIGQILAALGPKKNRTALQLAADQSAAARAAASDQKKAAIFSTIGGIIGGFAGGPGGAAAGASAGALAVQSGQPMASGSGSHFL